MLEWLWWLVVQMLWLAQSIVTWLLFKLLWLVVWLLLPLEVVAFVAIRVAAHVLGRDVVHAWLKRQSLRLGRGTWSRTWRGGMALSVLPVRVLGWYVVYALWHSFVSLWWRPRWKPWPRAWSRRWRPAGRSGKSRTVAKAR